MNSNADSTLRDVVLRPHRIGDVVERFGMTPRQVRFYEDKGLIKPQRHNTNRYYDDADLERIATILRLTRYGFSLAEVKGMLGMRGSDIRSRLERKRAELAEDIEASKAALAALDGELSGTGGDATPVRRRA